MIRDMLRWVRPYRRALLVGGFSLVATTVLSSLAPWILKEGIDSFGSPSPSRPIEHFAIALFVLAAIEGVFRYFMRRTIIGVSRHVEYDLRRELYARIQRLPMGRFESFDIGDLMARSTNDLDAVRMVVGPGLMYTASTVLVVIVSLALLLRISPELTLWAFAPLPFLSAAVALVMRLIQDRLLRVQEGFANLTTRTRESLAGIRVIKAFAREPWMEEEFRRVNEDVVERNLALARVQRVFFPAIGLITGMALALVLGKGGLLVMQGKLTIGEFVAFTSYLFLLMWPMAALGWTINLFHRGKASWKRLRELLDAPLEPVERNVAPPPGRGSLEFREVSLLRGERPILESLSFSIRAGETVAIVGPTGAGKSTLLRLLARLFSPTHGEILLDGVPLESWDLTALRAALAFVPQESFLFSDTIHENLAVGAPLSTREVVRASAADARLLREIEGFTGGFDALVGERGITLSGGQRQRAALARALLRVPRLLLLDDAFSNMDTETEESILGNLRARLAASTVLLVSHRLSTIRRASRILYLEHGRLVEDGRHEELVAAGGHYARFVRRQQLLEELERPDPSSAEEVA